MRQLSGTAFPAPSGRSVTVQTQLGGTWHTVGPVKVSAAGAFSTVVPSGRYRIVVGSLVGPAVTVRSSG
jgi:hypothetical protein